MRVFYHRSQLIGSSVYPFISLRFSIAPPKPHHQPIPSIQPSQYHLFHTTAVTRFSNVDVFTNTHRTSSDTRDTSRIHWRITTGFNSHQPRLILVVIQHFGDFDPVESRPLRMVFGIPTLFFSIVSLFLDSCLTLQSHPSFESFQSFDHSMFSSFHHRSSIRFGCTSIESFHHRAQSIHWTHFGLDHEAEYSESAGSGTEGRSRRSSLSAVIVIGAYDEMMEVYVHVLW